MLDAMTGLLNQIGDKFELKTYSGMFYRFTYAESLIAKLARRNT
jgi:hypothetical protein